jgi:hypothetical protein
MENQTITKQITANVDVIGDVKDRAKYQDTTPALLLDVASIDGTKNSGGAQSESSEQMLHQLLMNTETSAQRTQSAKRKWQLATLVLAMLFAPAVAVIGWLFAEAGATGTRGGRLVIENQSMKEQLNLAGEQIKGFKDEIEAIQGRNIELTRENNKLKSQSSTPVSVAPPAARTEQKPVVLNAAAASPTGAAPARAPDASRIEAIKKGTFPSGTTKAELIMVLGEPDRTYKSRNYEQLVYFSRKPNRFWFIGDYLVQAGG